MHCGFLNYKNEHFADFADVDESTLDFTAKKDIFIFPDKNKPQLRNQLGLLAYVFTPHTTQSVRQF